MPQAFRRPIFISKKCQSDVEKKYIQHCTSIWTWHESAYWYVSRRLDWRYCLWCARWSWDISNIQDRIIIMTVILMTVMMKRWLVLMSFLVGWPRIVTKKVLAFGIRISRKDEPQYRSRHSDWLRTGRPKGRSLSANRVKNFHFCISSRPRMGSAQPPIQ
jgi:hypothetical protein